MRTISIVILSVLVLPTVGCDAERPARGYPARVVGVTDGDTLTVLAAGNRQVKVRLYGVDAPETGQDFGARAKQAASEMAFGKTVTILLRDTDRYGRTVAEVRLPDGRSLNRELVRSGMAWWYRAYVPRDRELSRLEAEARAAHRGLWAQAGTVPPWEWRAEKRNGHRAEPPKGGESGERRLPAPAAGPVVGNRRSHVYHRPDCRGVARMSPGNRVEFRSAAEAEREGMRKAGDCW